eukprot:8928893-Pyramimonas_sp.AAC.1
MRSLAAAIAVASFPGTPSSQTELCVACHRGRQRRGLGSRVSAGARRVDHDQLVSERGGPLPRGGREDLLRGTTFGR